MIDARIISELIAFRRERDWGKFHNTRNLSSALAIEAAELQEIFLWCSDEEVAARAAERRAEICHEVADLAILLTYICHDMSIDINEAVSEKLQINQNKYPVEKFRGSSKKYNQI